MADKLRQTAPISVRFSSGEIPDATKLDGLSVQFRRALGILEYVVGDAWNSGGDAFLAAVGISSYALMLPNLSRYIGQSLLTNPRIPNSSTVTRYTHLFSVSDSGKHEIQLSMPPTNATVFTWTGTNAPNNTPETNLEDVTSSNKWYVDRETGWCYFFTEIAPDWKVQYIPTVASEFGTEATHNMIPDPNTHASYGFQGCKIAYTNNVDNSQGYIIYLPPRGPLSATRRFDRSPQSVFDDSGNTENLTITPDNLPVTFWQHYDNGGSPVDGTVGSYAEHYRYALPKIVTDNWSASALLPQGLVYLWDHSQTGTVIEGLSIYAENAVSPRTYVLVASGAALDAWITNYMNTAYAGCGGTAALIDRDNHDPSFYPSTGLRVVTVGNGLSEAVSAMMKTLMDHDHGSANSQPGKQIEHGKLKGNFDGGEISGVSLCPSTLSQDWHSQYLHRAGYGARDIYGNGMLGDLFMCSSSSSANYQNVLADSRRILFGNPETGPTLGYDATNNALKIGGTYGTALRIVSTMGWAHFGSLFGLWVLYSSDRLCLVPADNEIGLGTNGAVGDYLKIYPGIGAEFYVGNVADNPNGSFLFPGQIVIQNSGGIPGVGFTGGGAQARLTVTSYDIVFAEDGNNPGDRKGGQLGANRIWGGDKVEVDYGDSGGWYGPVRRALLSPDDFIIFDGVNAIDEAPFPENVDQHVVSASGSDGSYETHLSLYLNGDFGVGVEPVAIGYVKLPFAQYGIVNVYFMLKSKEGAGLQIGDGYVALGYSSWGAGIPVGVLMGENDFTTACLNSGITGYIGNTNWIGNSGFGIRAFTPGVGSPLVEVDNTYPGCWGAKVPWVRFRVGNAKNYLITSITVLYRIKEW